MEAMCDYDSDTSYVWEDDEARFTLSLPYVPLHACSSSSSSSDDNAVELLSDLKTTSDIEMMESAAAAAMPLA